MSDIDVSDMDALLQSVIDKHDGDPQSELDEESAAMNEFLAETATTLEEAAEMTEEEIARLLESVNQSDEPDVVSNNEVQMEEILVNEMQAETDELADLLSESDDADLKEIQSLLQKADNNEIIEASVEDTEPLGETLSKAEEKARQREAKKEAKQAAKEAKLADKEARKAAKEARKAEKEAQKAQKAELKKQKKTSVTEDYGGEIDFAAETDSDAVVANISTDDILQDDLMRELGELAFLSGASSSEDMQEKNSSDGGDLKNKNADKKNKKGLFARFKDFINEEDDESENEELLLSDENKAILKEIDKEKKKEQKAKKKKGKKKQESGTENTEEDRKKGEDEEDKEKAGKSGKKAKKEKKPKKEKLSKEITAQPAGKKLPLKKVIMVFVVCLSIGFAILVFVQVVGDYSVKQTAKKAFYAEDYQTCYQSLFGKNLSETEQVMYSKSESILTIGLWIREYELLAEEGDELKALDSLLQSVYQYPTLYTYATNWNAGAEVEKIYNQMLTILAEKYHLTEEQAKEITNNPDDIEYTRMVMAIVQGEEFGSWNQQEIPVEEPDVLKDPLPEEEELGDLNFVDNQNAQ